MNLLLGAVFVLAQAGSGFTVSLHDVREAKAMNVSLEPVLRVSLKLSGTDIDGIAGILFPVSIEVAQSDDGRDLRPSANMYPRFINGYSEFNRRTRSPIDIELQPPRTTATSVTLKGSLRLHKPDPAKAAIQRIPNVLSRSGVPVSSPELTKRELQIVPFMASDLAAATETVRTQRQLGRPLTGAARIVAEFYGGSGVSGASSGINVLVTDPNRQLLRLRLEDAGGNEIRDIPRGMGGVGAAKAGYFTKRTHDFQFQDPPQDKTTLVIELYDESQIVTVPFDLVVPLP